MNHQVIVRQLAENDLDQAAEYYAAIDWDLPGQFLTDFAQLLNRLLQFPLIGRPRYRGVRVLPFSTFPYNVYYQVDGHSVIIVAVIHQKRDPEGIRETVQRRR